MSSIRSVEAILIVLLVFNYFHNSESNSVTTKSEYFNNIVLSDNKIKDSLNSNDSGRGTISTSGLIKSTDVIQEKLEPNFMDFYHDGVQAYLENDWDACIDHLERSVRMYNAYIEAVANCRVQCEFERVKFKNTHPEEFDHIHFYEKLIAKTLCLEKCRQKNLSYMPRYFVIDEKHDEVFKIRKPYEYLQLCYYKEGQLDKSISATYTVLVVNPGDDLMKKNFQYHSQQKDFNWDGIKDLEEKRFSSLYQDAVDKYEQKQWKESIELLEIAIDIYLQEHDKCRALCEKEFDQGWLPDFTTSVANHYVYTLRCKSNCTNQLSFLNGRFHHELYPIMYNYLQFAYYSADDILEASRCAASYLLFYPDHEEMLDNVQFYKNHYNETSKVFLKPREEARKFMSREIYEMQLLTFVDEEFSKLAKEPFRPAPETDHLSDREIDDAEISNVIKDT